MLLINKIYFESQKRSFLESLPKHVEFIKKHHLKLSILLCKELEDDFTKGITFKCIKDCYNKLDIIELEKCLADDCADDSEENSNPFEELIEALKCNTWSNINILSNLNIIDDGCGGDDDGDDDENKNDEHIEMELDKFENLLTQLTQFRPNASQMSRDDRLNYAQNFAEIFEKLILQDENK